MAAGTHRPERLPSSLTGRAPIAALIHVTLLTGLSTALAPAWAASLSCPVSGTDFLFGGTNTIPANCTIDQSGAVNNLSGATLINSAGGDTRVLGTITNGGLSKGKGVGGTLDNPLGGTITINPTGTLNNSTNGVVNDAGDIDNVGRINNSASFNIGGGTFGGKGSAPLRTLTNQSGSVLNNSSGGTLTIESGATFVNSAAGGKGLGVATTNNDLGATIDVQVGGTLTNGGTINNSGIISNGGTVTVGTKTVFGKGTAGFTGLLNNDTGSTLVNLSGGTLDIRSNFNNGVSIGAKGGAGGKGKASGLNNQSGGIVLVGNGATLGNLTGANLSNSGQLTIQLGGTLKNTGNLIDTGSGSLILGGTLDNLTGSNLSNSGRLTIQLGGTLNNTGNLNNTGSGTLNIGGTLDNEYQGTFHNAGTINVQGKGTGEGKGTGGLFTNGETPIVFGKGGKGTGFDRPAQFVNTGNLVVGKGGTVVNNQGSVIVNEGALIDNGLITGPGTLTQSAGGSSTIDGTLRETSLTIDGGVFNGTGYVFGNFANPGGTLWGGQSNGLSPGTLYFSAGTFTEGGSGNLIELIGGISNSSEIVTTDPTIGGTLQVETLPGFNLAAGQTYTVLSFAPGTLVGEFSQIDYGNYIGNSNQVVIGHDLVINALYNNGAGTVDLVVAPIPEPAETWTLLAGLATLSFLIGRKRRAIG